MATDLTPYREIIHSLAPLVNQATFNKAFNEGTQSVASELKFLLKMEIKRLAKPCIRSIDLRQKVNDECRLFSYEGIPHYLHVNAIFEFEKLVKRYGEYTFGVYEGVLDFAEQEQKRLALVKTQAVFHNDTLLEIPDDKFITPCQDLLNYPTRKEERLNYVVALELFFPDNSSATASSLDISVSGIKIRFKDPKYLHNLRVGSSVHLIFRGLSKTTGVNKDAIEYEVLGLSGRGAKTCIHLLRPDIAQNPKFNEFVKALVKQQKRRYKVNLDNVEMALASKVYEQSFSSNNTSLPVFIGKDENGHLSPLYASYNGCAKKITEYWLNEKYQQMLGYLLSAERIKRLMTMSKAYPQTTVFCFHHIANEKIYFYSAFLEELEEQPKLAETFLAYGARRVSWRVFHLAYHDLDTSLAYLPTSLPDGLSRDIDKKNKALSPRLIGRLSQLKGMVSITDITNSSSQEVYQRRKLEKERIKLLRFFGHPRNKPPHGIEGFRHKLQDLRRQTRYVLRTPVFVSSNTQKIKGFTEDFSISGLRLQLDTEFDMRQNSKVTISFPKLQEIATGFDLTQLDYRVKHLSSDKLVLHLQADTIDETNQAEQFFRQLIDNNTDKLQALHDEEKIPGMSIALRNLHARTTAQVCIYIEKKQNGFIPAMATTNQVQAEWLKFLHHNANLVSVNLECLFQDDEQSTAFIRNTVKNMMLDPRPVTAEIFIAYDPQAPNKHNQINARWEYQLSTHRAKKSFAQHALLNGQFFAFSVTINKSLRPDLEQLEHELLYLSQHAIHKATHFEERMWDIAACILLTDITSEVKYRYRLPLSE